MKILISIAVIFLTLGLALEIEAATLAWEKPSGDVIGYRIHIGTSPGNYSVGSQDVGNVLEYNIANLYSAGLMTSGTVYYLTVKAYNDDGEGDSTDEVSYGLGIPMAVILTDRDDPNQSDPIYRIAKLTYIDSEGNTVREVNYSHNSPPNTHWYPLSVSLAANGQGSLLWSNLSRKENEGRASIWYLSADGEMTNYQVINYDGNIWTPRCHSLNADGSAEMLWDNRSGMVSIWFLDSAGQYNHSQTYTYTQDIWFLVSYTSTEKGGAFIWDNRQQTPQADTWLWLDPNFGGDINSMSRFKTWHYVDTWTPISSGIRSSYYGIEHTVISWLYSGGQRVVTHFQRNGENTGKSWDLSFPAEDIIWVDTR